MSRNREEALLGLALEKPAPRRPAFLDAVCGGDVALRARLEALLAAHEQPTTVGATQAETAPPGPGIRFAEAPDEAAGQALGRYKLLEKLGEGGFGTVWAAEQREPVKRRVALKVIKLGMDTKQVVARFEAERQALAMMDHPNIAKVLDAGTTDTGRPYFVMELVRGVRITDYCDQASLNTQDRLELFIKVCQAIQHAHQKGIIHRDIKPSNILVTLHDGVPVPKVIDFGIAKATQQELTELTIYTQHHQFIGTPAYMSPEQAEMSGLDIDTRSDIYSLGVLLYELLAGSPPFDPKELMSGGIDAMRRTIREKEPPRPSTRLATLGANQLSTTARRRSVDTSKLLHQLRGDLDWIVMKCLEKDRQRRYETANGLAADLRRHLENEPVVARPPSTGYRLQKLVRRNRLAFAATGAIALALTVGAAVSIWQAIRARSAEALAVARLADSEAITRFLTQVFESPDPARDGRTITVAESLGRAAARLEADLGTQPARRAQLQATLGVTYQALSLYGEAVVLLEKVLAHHRSASGLEHPDTLEAMLRLGGAYFDAGRWEDAARLDEEALPLFRRVRGPEHPDTLRAMVKLAACYDRLGRTQDAFQLKEQSLALTRKVRGPEHVDTLTAANNMAYLYSQVGRHPEAISLQEEVLALRRKVSGPRHPATIWAVMNLGLIYREGGRLEDALKAGRLCVELFRALSGLEHRDTLNAMTELAMTHRAMGHLDEAISLEEETLKLKRQHLPVGHPMTLESMDHLATCYEKAGRQPAAEQLRQEAAGLRAKARERKPAKP